MSIKTYHDYDPDKREFTRRNGQVTRLDNYMTDSDLKQSAEDKSGFILEISDESKSNISLGHTLEIDGQETLNSRSLSVESPKYLDRDPKVGDFVECIKPIDHSQVKVGLHYSVNAVEYDSEDGKIFIGLDNIEARCFYTASFEASYFKVLNKDGVAIVNGVSTCKDGELHQFGGGEFCKVCGVTDNELMEQAKLHTENEKIEYEMQYENPKLPSSDRLGEWWKSPCFGACFITGGKIDECVEVWDTHHKCIAGLNIEYKPNSWKRLTRDDGYEIETGKVVWGVFQGEDVAFMYARYNKNMSFLRFSYYPDPLKNKNLFEGSLIRRCVGDPRGDKKCEEEPQDPKLPSADKAGEWWVVDNPAATWDKMVCLITGGKNISGNPYAFWPINKTFRIANIKDFPRDWKRLTLDDGYDVETGRVVRGVFKRYSEEFTIARKHKMSSVNTGYVFGTYTTKNMMLNNDRLEGPIIRRCVGYPGNHELGEQNAK